MLSLYAAVLNKACLGNIICSNRGCEKLITFVNIYWGQFQFDVQDHIPSSNHLSSNVRDLNDSLHNYIASKGGGVTEEIVRG